MVSANLDGEDLHAVSTLPIFSHDSPADRDETTNPGAARVRSTVLREPANSEIRQEAPSVGENESPTSQCRGAHDALSG
jgi:hypothetical protein